MENLNPTEKKALLAKRIPDFPAGVVQLHLDSLDTDYFNEFSVAEITGHIRKIAELNRSRPFSMEISPIEDDSCALTIIGNDYPGFFAALSGLLASHDFDIKLGKVFTYLPLFRSSPHRTQGNKIIDYLVLGHPKGQCASSAFLDLLFKEFENLIARLEAREYDKLRADLYRRIGEYLDKRPVILDSSRPPIQVQTDADDTYTILTIRGTDRKALLFSLSNALSLKGILIHKILTRADHGEFEDRIFITGGNYQPITDTAAINKLKVGIILMERFMSTLPMASDYQSAVQNFNNFLEQFLEKSGALQEVPEFEDFNTLSSLAKVLGVGPYLWEEFAKLQLEAVSPLFRKWDEEKHFKSKEDYKSLLESKLSAQKTFSEKFTVLNQFKDYELFHLDVVQVVSPAQTLDQFSRQLGDLAEVILEKGTELAYSRLEEIHGQPRLAEGLCPFGIFALGKFGGRELGYASDLEIVAIYGGSGESDGSGGIDQSKNKDERISNGDFFSQLVLELQRNIQVKASGIFELDLRLRPHGESGPLAANFENWREYYSPGGGALDYERQALIKLRPIAGNKDFIAFVLEAQNDIVYGSDTVDINNTLSLRAKQVELKAAGKRMNAKYSPGALVELEYAVQFLQLKHGRDNPILRQTNTGKALEGLLEAGILNATEFEKLYNGYIFLRRLINALRMVRGNSRDLWVPASGTDDFLYLAKRMGYVPTAGYSAESQLDWDIQHILKDISGFFSYRFLGAEVPPSFAASLSTGLLALESSKEVGKALDTVMEELGVKDAEKGKRLVSEILTGVKEKNIFCAILVRSQSKLRNSPDAEAVLRHLFKFLNVLPDPGLFIRQMLHHPPIMEVLIHVFGYSDYLTHILFQQPEYMQNLGDPLFLEKPKMSAEFQQEIQDLTEAASSIQGAMESLRKYRNREYLRIGLRDIYLNVHLQKLTAEISHLSNALIDAIFRLTLQGQGRESLGDEMCVIALGKLGGNELNYSSDIDIVFVYDRNRLDASGREIAEDTAKQLISALTQSSPHGKLFRVDTNLRPYGAQGNLTASVGHYLEYYEGVAEGWELQAWLKARPVTGNRIMAFGLIRKIQGLALSTPNRGKIVASMKKVRLLSLDKLQKAQLLTNEVKLGPGGIRTIEFYVQYLQICNGESTPELVTGNTLAALGILNKYRYLSYNYYQLLSRSYVFLRRVEHRIQLLGLQQRHVLPKSEDELEKLAKRMGFGERHGHGARAQFLDAYRRHMLTLGELSGMHFEYNGMEGQAGKSIL